MKLLGAFFHSKWFLFGLLAETAWLVPALLLIPVNGQHILASICIVGGIVRGAILLTKTGQLLRKTNQVLYGFHLIAAFGMLIGGLEILRGF